MPGCSRTLLTTMAAAAVSPQAERNQVDSPQAAATAAPKRNQVGFPPRRRRGPHWLPEPILYVLCALYAPPPSPRHLLSVLYVLYSTCSSYAQKEYTAHIAHTAQGMGGGAIRVGSRPGIAAAMDAMVRRRRRQAEVLVHHWCSTGHDEQRRQRGDDATTSSDRLWG